MRTHWLAFLSLLFFSSTACTDEFMIARTQRNLARLKSYRGTLSESGLIAAGDLRSEILFKSPSRFVARVVSPDAYAGIAMAYDGQTLTLYYPKINYAIRFEHLTAPSPQDIRSLIASGYRHNVATFNYDLGDEETVAGLPAIGLAYTAKRKHSLTTGGEMQVYDKFSFPLAGSVSFAGNVHYRFHFEQIAFNHELDDQLFEIALPKNVILSRWDMTSPDIAESDMRQLANFDYSLPTPPAGFVRERIVRIDGPVPAFTVVYRHGPQFVFLSLFKDTGLRPTPEEIGIPVAVANLRGFLLISPTVSSYTFSRAGTSYSFTSNLPSDQLLTLVNPTP